MIINRRLSPSLCCSDRRRLSLRSVMMTLIALVVHLMANAGDFIKTTEGIIVRPDLPFSGNARQIELKVIDDYIIRVIAVADKNIQQNKSLIISPTQRKVVKWNVTSNKQTVTLKTSRLTAIVDLQTGAVSFFDMAGKKILSEKITGRSIQPQVFEGEPLYGITQEFITSP